MAEFSLKALRLEVLRKYGQDRFQQFRIGLFMEAAEEVYRVEPGLAAEVARASAEHRRTCPRWSPNNPCLTCGPQVAAVVRERLSSSGAHVGHTQPEKSSMSAADSGEVETPACTGGDDSFICPNLGRRLSVIVGRMVGVTESRYEAGTGRFAFGFVTKHGDWGTGHGRAANEHDAWLQAVCLTGLDLSAEVSRVHMLCRDERAASVVQHVVRHRFVAEELGFPVTERTRELLSRVIRSRGKVSASASGCPQQHRGAGAAGRLADLALRARETGGTEELEAAADKIAEEFRGLAEKVGVQSPGKPAKRSGCSVDPMPASSGGELHCGGYISRAAGRSSPTA